MRMVFAAVALMVSTAPGSAQNVALMKTESLFHECLEAQRVFRGGGGSDVQSSMNTGSCIGALLGMNTVLNRLSQYDLLANKICSTNVTVAQIVDVYVRWVDQNPQHMNTLVADSFMAAMGENFGCLTHTWPQP